MKDFEGVIYWRTKTGVVLKSVFGPVAVEAMSRDTQGCAANKAVCRQHRPYGVTGWQTDVNGPWLPLESCPVPPLELQEKGR